MVMMTMTFVVCHMWSCWGWHTLYLQDWDRLEWFCLGRYIQCESKNPPLRFSDIFPKRLGILYTVRHDYRTPSTKWQNFVTGYYAVFWPNSPDLNPVDYKGWSVMQEKEELDQPLFIQQSGSGTRVFVRVLKWKADTLNTNWASSLECCRCYSLPDISAKFINFCLSVERLRNKNQGGPVICLTVYNGLHQSRWTVKTLYTTNAATVHHFQCLIISSAEVELNLLDARHVDRLHALVDFDEEAKSRCGCDCESSKSWEITQSDVLEVKWTVIDANCSRQQTGKVMHISTNYHTFKNIKTLSYQQIINI